MENALLHTAWKKWDIIFKLGVFLSSLDARLLIYKHLGRDGVWVCVWEKHSTIVSFWRVVLSLLKTKWARVSLAREAQAFFRISFLYEKKKQEDSLELKTMSSVAADQKQIMI